MCHVIRSRPSQYYRNKNRITICLITKSRGKYADCLQGHRLPSILLAGKECRARERGKEKRALVGEGFSRHRFAAFSKIPIILGSIKTSRRRARQKERLAVIRCAKYHAISWRITFRPFFFPSAPASLGEHYRPTYIATLRRLLFPRISPY